MGGVEWDRARVCETDYNLQGEVGWVLPGGSIEGGVWFGLDLG